MEIRIIKDVLVQALGAAQGFISKTDNTPVKRPKASRLREAWWDRL